MGRLSLALFAVLLCAQETDDGTKCGPIPENGVHECHCANMVQAHRSKYLAACKDRIKSERENCVHSLPAICDVMDYPDRYGMQDHPDQCLNKCKKHSCTCSENSCNAPYPKEVKKKGKKK